MKITNMAIALVLGITMIAGVACGSETASSTPSPTTTPPYYPPLPTVAVNESNSGGQVNLVINGALLVTLASNPSTGYSWNISSISNDSVIAKVSNEYVAPEQTDPPMVGQPGHEIWAFSAKAAGTATISMRYFRPWEPTEAAGTFNITVNVEQISYSSADVP